MLENRLAGRYLLGRPLGQGGMSTVYRAVDEALGRDVAIKILSPLASDPSAVERAQSEIRVLASLSHRGLVTLFDAGSAPVDGADKTYLVMELVDGPSLAERLREGPLTDPEATLLAREMAEALHAIHTRGVIHRDIKPGNILLAPGDGAGRAFDAKLADFGIATLVDRTSDLTVAGTIVGTAAYLSPEQPRGEPATAASDVYSLGIVLLEALTGTHPFPGTLAETVAARLSRSPDIPATLSYTWRSLLGAMTALSPADRPTARGIVARLDGERSPASTAVMTDGATGDRPTAVLPVDDTAAATRVLPSTAAATERLPAASVTERLPAEGGGSSSPRTRRGRRRGILVGVIGAAALAVAVTVAAVSGMSQSPDSGGTPATTQATPVGSASAAPSQSLAASDPATPAASSVPVDSSAPVVSPAPAVSAPVVSPAPVASPPGAGATTGGKSPGKGKGAGNGNGAGPGDGKKK